MSVSYTHLFIISNWLLIVSIVLIIAGFSIDFIGRETLPLNDRIITCLLYTSLVYIVNERNLWWDQRTIPLKNLLEEKQVGSGQWKIEYIYSHKGYKACLLYTSRCV